MSRVGGSGHSRSYTYGTPRWAMEIQSVRRGVQGLRKGQLGRWEAEQEAQLKRHRERLASQEAGLASVARRGWRPPAQARAPCACAGTHSADFTAALTLHCREKCARAARERSSGACAGDERKTRPPTRTSDNARGERRLDSGKAPPLAPAAPCCACAAHHRRLRACGCAVRRRGKKSQAGPRHLIFFEEFEVLLSLLLRVALHLTTARLPRPRAHTRTHARTHLGSTGCARAARPLCLGFAAARAHSLAVPPPYARLFVLPWRAPPTPPPPSARC